MLPNEKKHIDLPWVISRCAKSPNEKVIRCCCALGATEYSENQIRHMDWVWIRHLLVRTNVWHSAQQNLIDEINYQGWNIPTSEVCVCVWGNHISLLLYVNPILFYNLLLTVSYYILFHLLSEFVEFQLHKCNKNSVRLQNCAYKRWLTRQINDWLLQ